MNEILNFIRDTVASKLREVSRTPSVSGLNAMDSIALCNEVIDLLKRSIPEEYECKSIKDLGIDMEDAYFIMKVLLTANISRVNKCSDREDIRAFSIEMENGYIIISSSTISDVGSVCIARLSAISEGILIERRIELRVDYLRKSASYADVNDMKCIQVYETFQHYKKIE